MGYKPEKAKNLILLPRDQLRHLIPQAMSRKSLPLIAIVLWGFIALPVLSDSASAETPLTRAFIQNIRNLVQLLPKNLPVRKARTSDAIVPGDGLATGRSSLADLRFNDGTFTRIGERTVFRFLPKTRNFTLSNGTALLLIPPGRGVTQIQTPNAAASIRGSGLFVRYDEQTDTTIIGALTNSHIQVTNQNATEKQELKAGQLIILVKDKIQGIYDFDLETFYNTSELVQELNLNGKTARFKPDPELDLVRAETIAALAKQSPIIGTDVIVNPPFVQMSVSFPLNTNLNSTPINSALEGRQIQTNILQDSLIKPITNTPTPAPIPKPAPVFTPTPAPEPVLTASPTVIPSSVPPSTSTPIPAPIPTPIPTPGPTKPETPSPAPGNSPRPSV